MKYGILNENNELLLAPKKLHIDGKFCFNPPAELLEKAGYFPILEVDPPNNGKIYTATYALINGQIVQSWNE
jgi:hypothetical protein